MKYNEEELKLLSGLDNDIIKKLKHINKKNKSFKKSNKKRYEKIKNKKGL